MKKKEIIEKLKLARKDFDESLSGSALMIQFPEVFENIVEDAEDDEKPEKVEPKTAVHFKIRNAASKGGVSTRSYSLAEHGAGFLDLANEFEAANTHKKVLNSDSKTNAQEVLEVTTYNKHIPQPILSRTDE